MVLLWPAVPWMKLRGWLQDQEMVRHKESQVFKVRREYLLGKLSLEEVESPEMVQDPLHAVSGQAFGYLRAVWCALKAKLRPRDVRWSFTAQWYGQSGVPKMREGYSLWQCGKPVGAHPDRAQLDGGPVGVEAVAALFACEPVPRDGRDRDPGVSSPTGGLSVPSPLLFLDFDGMLHPGSGVESDLLCRTPDLEEALAGRALRLLVSSSWRFHMEMDAVLGMLPPGLAQRVVGQRERPTSATGRAFTRSR